MLILVALGSAYLGGVLAVVGSGQNVDSPWLMGAIWPFTGAIALIDKFKH